MTRPDEPFVPDPDADELIDGHSVDRLSDYLDSGRSPRDAAIESSAECRLYLAALSRVRTRSTSGLLAQADAEPDREDVWISSLLDSIRSEVRSGRDIPIAADDPAIRLTLTEAAVQGAIRHAADELDHAILGRCTLEGDVVEPGAPITITVTASTRFGHDLRAVADDLRVVIARTVSRHTELNVVAIDVVIDDIHPGPRSAP